MSRLAHSGPGCYARWMRTLLFTALLAALAGGCAQLQKDLDKSANYGAGQAQGRIDKDTGQSTTEAQQAGSDAAKRVDAPETTKTATAAQP